MADGPAGGDRLAGLAAVVVGAGQTPGQTIGNGRATALLFARHGANVLCVDRRAESAEETVEMIRSEDGMATAHTADVIVEDECRGIVERAVREYGRVDVLHNNVGIGGRDGPVERLEVDVWDRILDVNLRGMWLTIKHAVPVMREQAPRDGLRGAIVNVSSLAAVAPAGITAYEISKAGVNKLTTTVAAANAKYGIRCNAIMPGLIDTPMAVDTWAAALGRPRDEIRAARDARVPLRGRMGTAWDVACAALYLASDEAAFVTGVVLPVDGGASARIG